jgi:hypothetical protein
MTRHTDKDIEQAAARFEQVADSLDPDTAQVEGTDDLREIATAAGGGASRRCPLVRGGGPRSGTWPVLEPHRASSRGIPAGGSTAVRRQGECLTAFGDGPYRRQLSMERGVRCANPVTIGPKAVSTG